MASYKCEILMTSYNELAITSIDRSLTSNNSTSLVIPNVGVWWVDGL